MRPNFAVRPRSKVGQLVLGGPGCSRRVRRPFGRQDRVTVALEVVKAPQSATWAD